MYTSTCAHTETFTLWDMRVSFWVKVQVGWFFHRILPKPASAVGRDWVSSCLQVLTPHNLQGRATAQVSCYFSSRRCVCAYVRTCMCVCILMSEDFALLLVKNQTKDLVRTWIRTSQPSNKTVSSISLWPKNWPTALLSCGLWVLGIKKIVRCG